MLSREMLAETGSQAPGIVQKDIEWFSGGEQRVATVNVKPRAYDTMMAEMKMGGHADVLVRRVLTSIVNPDGSPLFELSDIVGNLETGEGRMVDTLFLALLQAVNEANNFSGK